MAKQQEIEMSNDGNQQMDHLTYKEVAMPVPEGRGRPKKSEMSRAPVPMTRQMRALLARNIEPCCRASILAAAGAETSLGLDDLTMFRPMFDDAGRDKIDALGRRSWSLEQRQRIVAAMAERGNLPV